MIYPRAPLPNVPPLEQKTLRHFDDLLLRYLNEQDQNLDNIFSNGIRFDDNFDASIVTFTSSGTPDAENAVAHDLGKVPEGFLVVGMNKGAVVYDSGTTNTETTIYLKVNTATVVVKIIVF